MFSWLKSPSKRSDPSPAPAEEPILQSETSLLAEGPQVAAVGRNRRILVVDDDAVVLKAFEMKLKSSGFTVFSVSDASVVAGTAQKVKPELILLDVNFPPSGAGMEWSGLTAIQWLRRFPELSSIPVIIISGADGAALKDKALAAGARAFFQKPVSFNELLSSMLKALGISQAAPAA